MPEIRKSSSDILVFNQSIDLLCNYVTQTMVSQLLARFIVKIVKSQEVLRFTPFRHLGDEAKTILRTFVVGDNGCYSERPGGNLITFDYM